MRAMHAGPPAQGLYDPRFEHDACGVAFVATLTGEVSHDIVRQALTALRNLDHRGAAGAEVNSGDGAGILLQVPDAFLREVVDFTLPGPGAYAVGTAFLTGDPDEVAKTRQRIEELAEQEGLSVLGWRDVPVDPVLLGKLLDLLPGLGDVVAVAVEERRPDGVGARAGELEVDDVAQERVRDLEQDAGAVAGVHLGAGRAAVVEVAQRGERLAHDVVARLAGESGHERDPAGVVLEPRVVQPLGGRAGRQAERLGTHRPVLPSSVPRPRGRPGRAS